MKARSRSYWCFKAAQHASHSCSPPRLLSGTQPWIAPPRLPHLWCSPPSTVVYYTVCSAMCTPCPQNNKICPFRCWYSPLLPLFASLFHRLPCFPSPPSCRTCYIHMVVCTPPSISTCVLSPLSPTTFPLLLHVPYVCTPPLPSPLRAGYTISGEQQDLFIQMLVSAVDSARDFSNDALDRMIAVLHWFDDAIADAFLPGCTKCG